MLPNTCTTRMLETAELAPHRPDELTSYAHASIVCASTFLSCARASRGVISLRLDGSKRRNGMRSNEITPAIECFVDSWAT